MPKRRCPRTSTLVVLLLVAACSKDSATAPGATSESGAQSSKASSGDVIATYDKKTFTTEDFRREVERLPPRSRLQLTTPDRKRQFVDNYILSEILAAKGQAQGYDKDPDVVRQVDDLRRRLVVQRVMKDIQEPPELTDEEIKAYYDQNQKLFSGSQVRASHILVKDEDLAKRLRQQIQEDPSKFEELAKEHSTDTATATRGGDLGFFGQGRMVGEFERAAFSLEKLGDISDVVKSPFGFHIIKLTERKEGNDKPFDEVKDRIRVTLINQRRQAQVNERFEALKTAAKVTVNEAVLAAVDVPGAVPAPGMSPGVPGFLGAGGASPGLGSAAGGGPSPGRAGAAGANPTPGPPPADTEG